MPAGSCASTEGERGVWGLVPANASNPAEKVYFIMNRWRAPAEPRVGDWLGVSGQKVVLSPKAEPAAGRIAWALVPAAAAPAATAAADSTADGALSGPVYLQDRASGAYIGLAGGEVVAPVPAASRVAFSFVVAPPPNPPPLPPPPECGDGISQPPCVCPHPPDGPPPPCAAWAPPTCAPPGCDPARFLGTDTTTQGAFRGKFGKIGYVLFGLNTPSQHAESLPPYMTAVTVGGNGTRQLAWPAASTFADPRSLHYAGSHVYPALGYIAATKAVTNASSSSSSNSNSNVALLEFTVAVSTAAPSYKLSVYAVDFEGDGCSCEEPPSCCTDMAPSATNCSHAVGRVQIISLHSASGDLVAPAQQLKDFEGGVYLRFGPLHGNVTMRLAESCAGRGDTMLNAVFFDPAE